MEFVEQLKSSVDIVKVVGRIRAPAQVRRALHRPVPVPQREDALVHRPRGHQFYKCFGCGAGGDVIKFVRRSRASASTRRSNCSPSATASPCPSARGYSDPDTRLRAAALPDARTGRGGLPQPICGRPPGAEARAYLEQRGVAPETMEQFGLGYADRSGRVLLRLFEQQRFTPSRWRRSGLVGKRAGRQLLRPLPQPPDVPHPQRNGQGDRLRRPRAGRRRRAQVLKLARKRRYIRRATCSTTCTAPRKASARTDRVVLVEGYMDVIGVFRGGRAGGGGHLRHGADVAAGAGA